MLRKLTLAAVLALVAPAFAEAPPVFQKISLAEAKAANVKGGKILVVKATAEWCKPCKMMDQTTWVDAKVVAWFKDHGAAMQLDVDREQGDARALNIAAMPTMVAFKDGNEIDRIVGYKTADQLLEWLGALQKGETSSSRLLKRLEKIRTGEEKAGMQERFTLATDLMQAQRFDEAGEEFAWLWENMVAKDPSMVGVRNSFLVGSIQRLVAEHPASGERFRGLRDRVEARLKGEKKTWDDLGDWLGLNEILGDNDATLAWFDRIKGDKDSGATLQRFGSRLERLLEERDRYADIAILYKDPIKKLERDDDRRQMMARMAARETPEEKAASKKWADDEFRKRTATLYVGLLLSTRDAEAAAFAKRAMEIDADKGMVVALLTKAIEQKQPREEHREWLAAWSKRGQPIEGLDKYLEDALRAK